MGQNIRGGRQEWEELGGAPPNHTWSVTLGWGRGTPAVINKRVSAAQLRREREGPGGALAKQTGPPLQVMKLLFLAQRQPGCQG